MNPLLSVIVPAYNESKRIGVTLKDLKRYFATKAYSYEIIVVNDGSTDDTTIVVQKFQIGFPQLKLIDNKENHGKGYAVKCGMLAAKGHYRLFMDADNSVKIDTLDEFFDEMQRNDHDIVIGSIALSNLSVIEHNGWHRRIFGSISKFIIRTVATPGIYDTQRGFKLFSSRAARILFPLQKISRFGFDIEILTIAQIHGLSIKEKPVEWDNPDGSTVKMKAYLDSLIELGQICINKLRGEYNRSPRGYTS